MKMDGEQTADWEAGSKFGQKLGWGEGEIMLQR